MKWILRILGLVVFVVVIVLIIGLALPAKTAHTRTITLKQPPAKVFAVLADVQDMPKWNRNMVKVEMLAPVDGKETTRQTFRGGMTMIITTAVSVPPAHLVRELGDAHGPFSGSWSYGIVAVPGGSQVALTEQSKIPNPFFRVMVKIFGPTKYIDEHLQDLAKYFGETATIR